MLLSLGGAVGTYGFTDDSQASDFATTLWNIFGGGTSDYRPFGSSIVDGFDLDIENNNPTGYAAFVTQMRNLYSGGDYYISAAPQCPFPDASVGDALDNAWFDFVFIQFYNNNCGVNSPSTFNYGTDWMTWVSSTAQNSNVKLYVGVPGSSTAAGSGYVTPDSLGTLLSGISDKSSLGGVMIWDASQAFANEVDGTTFAAGIKSMLNNIGDSPTEATSTAATSRIAETSSQAAAIDTIIFSSTQAQNLFLVPSTSSDTAPTSTAVLTSTEAVPAAATTESLTVPTSAGAESPTSITLETTSTIVVPNSRTLTLTSTVTLTISSTSAAPTLSTVVTVAPSAVEAAYVNGSVSSTATPSSTSSESLPSSTLAADSCDGLTGTPLASCMNSYYQTLTASDACTAGSLGCVGDLFAQCVSGAWTTFDCGTGTVCRALPSGDETATTFAIACDSESDIALRFGSSSKKSKRANFNRRHHRHHGHSLRSIG